MAKKKSEACLNCKSIKQTPGKRQKKFCSDICRASWGQKNRKKQSTPEAAPKKKETKVKDLTQPETITPITDPKPKSNFSVNTEKEVVSAAPVSNYLLQRRKLKQ